MLYFNQTARRCRQGQLDCAQRQPRHRSPRFRRRARFSGTIKADRRVLKSSIATASCSAERGQVNVRTFVASSLSLSNEQFRAGINNTLSIFRERRLRSRYSDLRGQFDRHGADEHRSLRPDARKCRCRGGRNVESHSGGKAMLFAPRVANAGTIRTPNGQVLFRRAKMSGWRIEVE